MFTKPETSIRVGTKRRRGAVGSALLDSETAVKGKDAYVLPWPRNCARLTTPQGITLWCKHSPPCRQQLDEQVRYAKMERRRQEKVTLGGSLGTSFSGRCSARLEKVKDKRRASLKDWRTNLVVQFDHGSSDATHAVSQATTVIQK
ncbi:hypothetical protein O3P69_014178 [Scylla paramamosain]|uniref:Uncharacterized protein n=1 Tax=Scylla paramamosain TaxID=85552 RepID=A0AAW0SF43_SCYPA